MASSLLLTASNLPRAQGRFDEGLCVLSPAGEGGVEEARVLGLDPTQEEDEMGPGHQAFFLLVLLIFPLSLARDLFSEDLPTVVTWADSPSIFP